MYRDTADPAPIESSSLYRWLHSKTETQNLSVHQGPRRGCHRPRGGCKGAFRLQVGGREVRGRKREFATANDYVLEYVSSMGGRPRAPRKRRALQAIWAGRAFGSPPPIYSIARRGSRTRGIFKVRVRSPSISLCEYTPIHDHVMSWNS